MLSAPEEAGETQAAPAVGTRPEPVLSSETGCLSDAAIAALVEGDGALSAAAIAAAHAHAAVCPDCRRMVAAAAHAATTAGSLSAAARSAPRALPATVPRGARVGRYVVRELLGAGGMSVVYAAEDPVLARRIALKFLRLHGVPPEGAGDRRAAPDAPEGVLPRRLLREAQALARLSHPNVVAVYDTGVYEGRLFIAMELVDGTTLAEWLHARPRPPGEIIGLFCRAAAGLMAAHRVGIVHRDFKPTNVLLSAQGDVRVTDFGLAQLMHEPPEPRAPRSVPGATVHDSDRSAEPLTQSGALVGTPAYMAPEQFLGEPVTPRTDQFSFCVALYEALYGERPFADESAMELMRSVTSGVPRPAPGAPTGSDRRVPAAVRRALLRGLSRDPDARFPDLEELVRELAIRPQQRRRWRVAMAAAAGGLLLLGTGAALLHKQRTLCQGASRKLAGVWDEPTRARLAAAFTSTGLPFAATTFREVERVLSGYARSYADMHKEACEATQLRGEQSPQLLDLRMACLEQRHKELAALSQLLQQPDRALVERAVAAVQALPSLAPCADGAQLLRVQRLPQAPEARQRAVAIETRLAQVRALRSAGQYQRGLREAERLLVDARDLGPVALLADTQQALGRLQENTGELVRAEASYYQALWTAEASHDDHLAATAWIDLLYVIGASQAKFGQVETLTHHAEAALLRAGQPLPLRAQLDYVTGAIRSEQGNQPAAIESLLKAQAALIKLHGAAHREVFKVQTLLGGCYARSGRLAEALAVYRELVASVTRQLGSEHPQALSVQLNLAGVLNDLGRPAEALPVLTAARPLIEAALPAPHLYRAGVHTQLGSTLARLHRHAEAREHIAAALRQQEQLFGPEHPRLIVNLGNLSGVLRDQGHAKEAAVPLERAVRIAVKAYGADHVNVAELQGARGELLLAAGDPGGAAELLRSAVRIYERAQPAGSAELVNTLCALGRAELALGRAGEAEALLSRALRKVPSVEGLDESERQQLSGEIEVALARALLLQRRDGVRARRLLDLAHQAAASSHSDELKAQVDEARGLLASRPRRAG